MKKTLKIFALIIMIILTILFALFIYVFSVTASAKLDESKLVDLDKTITFYDKNNEIIVETVNKTPVTESENIWMYKTDL